MSIAERITALRALMADRGYDVYMVPTDDNHQSEYVGEHFKARAFITGFTGSAGTAVITKDEATTRPSNPSVPFSGITFAIYSSTVGTPGSPILKSFTPERAQQANLPAFAKQ